MSSDKAAILKLDIRQLVEEVMEYSQGRISDQLAYNHYWGKL